MLKIKNKRYMILTTILVLSVASYGLMVYADTSDSVLAYFYLNALPNVNNVDFVDSTYTLTSSLTPNDNDIFGVNFTVSTSGSIADIKNCTIYVFDDSVHGSDYDSASPDGIFLIVGVWNESDDLWTIDQGSMTQWTLQSPVDPGSASALNQFTFCFRYDISKVARADTDWNASVIVWDDTGPSGPENDTASETGLVTMENNFELSFSLENVTWGNVAPSTVNATHQSLILQIYANNDWELLINATDFNTTIAGPADVDIETTNVLIWDEDGVAGGTSLWVRNTIQTGLGTWDARSPMVDESGFTRSVYLYLSTGLEFTLGYTWQTTFYTYIQLDT